MRVLFLTPRLPYPPVGGDKKMIYQHLLGLVPRVESCHLLSMIEDESELEAACQLAAAVPGLQVRCVRVARWRSYVNTLMGLAFSRVPLQVHYYRSRIFAAHLDALLGDHHFDAAVLHLVRMGQYVPQLEGIRTVLALTDCLTLRYRRSAPFLRGKARLIDGIERRRIPAYECRATGKVDVSFVVAEEDRLALEALGAPGRIETIPLGVDLDFFAPDAGEEPAPRTFSFLGNLHSVPNRDAVAYLAESVWPLVRQAYPDARLQIIGIHPTPAIRALDGRDGIVVTGPVEDVRPWLRRSVATLCPVRIGAGMQTKILESLALGVPVITTPVGFEGLGAREGDGVLVGDTPEALAAAADRLLRDGTGRADLARRGRDFVERHYAWQDKMDRLFALLAGPTREDG